MLDVSPLGTPPPTFPTTNPQLHLSFKAVDLAAVAFQRREGRFVHSTPKTYLELLKLYGTLLEAKREANDTATARLANGIDTLDQCASAVKELEVSLSLTATLEADSRPNGDARGVTFALTLA